MSIKILKNKINKIISITKNLKKTKLIAKILLKELVFLNLAIENMLTDSKNKNGNPIKITNEYLDKFLLVSMSLRKFSEFDKKIFLKKIKFIKEKEHKKLFPKIWTLYNFKEYKQERLARYFKRIKINNLKKKIVNKKIIDFGCGHGNFLVCCHYLGAKYCYGFDFGVDSIVYGNKILKKLKIDKNKIRLTARTVYNSGQKRNSYDFAIANGVFHHCKDQPRANREVYRVLKPGGYFWIYVAGDGGIRNLIWDMQHKILENVNKEFILDELANYGLSTNKEYHLGDDIAAITVKTSLKKLKKMLIKIGFTNFKQVKGGTKTDYDKPFSKDKYFNEKFGDGDLRFICQKKY